MHKYAVCEANTLREWEMSLHMQKLPFEATSCHRRLHELASSSVTVSSAFDANNVCLDNIRLRNRIANVWRWASKAQMLYTHLTLNVNASRVLVCVRSQWNSWMWTKSISMLSIVISYWSMLLRGKKKGAEHKVLHHIKAVWCSFSKI